MTQIELKREIENTREDLNAAIAGNMTKSRILDISRLLDGLIEEYMESYRAAEAAAKAEAAAGEEEAQ